MSRLHQFDLAIVGAGIAGLAHALAASRRGLRVVVIDRDAQANGASVRNFGFVTVSGQERGQVWRRAMRSRDIWLEVAGPAGIDIIQRGTVVVARRQEARAVVEAFLLTEMGGGCRLLEPEAIARDHPNLAAMDFAGALWSGPPFESRIWRSVTDRRNAGTPQWLPQFRDGSIVRFLNQQGSPVPLNRPWGPMRIVYLQYASDPIVFFNYRDLYRRPDWLKQPRGPDVSPDLRWYPVVTMLQIALDMAVATTTPMGHGHVYAPEDYVDAWVAVTDVTGWTPEALAGLKQHFRTAFPRGDVKDDSARGG